MRPLASLLFLAAAAVLAADQPATLDHARYAAALKEFRTGAAKSVDALAKADASVEVRRAAVDDIRERLVDEPASPLTGAVAALLGQVDVPTAKLLLAALAEAKAAGAAPAVAKLAAQADSPLRVDAALALAEVGGAKAVPILAGLAKDESIREEVVDALAKISGAGVTDAFVAGIQDAKGEASGRAALIRAAVVRNNRGVVGALCAAVREEELRLEAQKALLKLAQPADLPALRAAAEAVTNAPTKAALGRLIAKLEKPAGK